MFKFEREQKVFNIGDIKVGGQPGEYPTVLIGSMFYWKHSIVKDHKRGIFNEQKARSLIEKQDRLSELTGNPCMVDIEGFSNEAIERYINFVSKTTESPFLINSTAVSVRLYATKYVSEIGLNERVIYASINFKTTQKEIDEIKSSKVDCALVQTFNPKNPYPLGAVQILKEESLLEKALKAGIKKPILLASVLEVPDIPLALETVFLLKKEFGLPTGVAPVGVVGQWAKRPKLEKLKTQTKYLKECCEVTSVAICQLSGADFIHYGSIRKAEYIFPVVSLVDAIMARQARYHGIKLKTKEHPFYKIL
ncbi:hypothetical protein DRO54_05620 [Candidatus Bathyarchaeota archaeon]|nr:MAG: hypothetical protein DRO54_05620 [Candidatus Bathyarchaeota archaeon]